MSELLREGRSFDIAVTLFEALGIPYNTMLGDIADGPRQITGGTPFAPLLG